MRLINIYVKESCDALNSKKGSYTTLLSTLEKQMKITKEFENTTNYRMIIQGVIDSIKKLKEPCEINLYTNTTFGMSRIRNKNGEWKDQVSETKPNMDLLVELRDLIIKGEHKINNFYDKTTVDKKIIGNEVSENINKKVSTSISQEMYEELRQKCCKKNIRIEDALKYALTEWLYN